MYSNGIKKELHVIPTLYSTPTLYCPTGITFAYLKLESSWADVSKILVDNRYKPLQTNVKSNPPTKFY